jgi:SNF family Na+-dependent transporter
LPLSAIAISIIIGFGFKKHEFIKLEKEMGLFFNIWFFAIRYIVPISIGITMANLLGWIAF